jgi:hypothetical protein
MQKKEKKERKKEKKKKKKKKKKVSYDFTSLRGHNSPGATNVYPLLQ